MKLSTEVLKTLSEATINIGGVQLAGQLERKLYVATAKALEAAGAKWNRKTGMHVFNAEDARDRVEQMILTGEVTTPQDVDFFPTPANIVELMISNADLEPEHEVLEPSAGQGAIACAVQRIGAKHLCCIESDIENWRKLCLALKIGAASGQSIMVGDFTKMSPADTGTFDRILMNPPFSKRADIIHVIHAWQFLKAGGKLVSIASAGIQFRTDNMTKALRRLIEDNGGAIHDLPDGAFKSSGTMVNTVMIVIDKR